MLGLKETQYQQAFNEWAEIERELTVTKARYEAIKKTLSLNMSGFATFKHNK